MYIQCTKALLEKLKIEKVNCFQLKAVKMVRRDSILGMHILLRLTGEKLLCV